MKGSIYKLAKLIRLVIFDIDGVLTDAQIYIGDNQTEFKAFNTQDGLGMQLLLKSGIEIGIITSQQSLIVATRMHALGIKHVFQGNLNKVPAYEELLKKLGLTDAQVAYVGDDLPDLKLIRRAGLGITVANAHDFVKKHAHYITKSRGGQGAVREICDLIMKVQHTYNKIYDAYL